MPRSFDDYSSNQNWLREQRVERSFEQEPTLHHRPRGVISAEARLERMLLAAGSAFVSCDESATGES
jgi:hypothetical protein